MYLGVQGWRSGESTRLPPMWPSFDSQSGLSLFVLYSNSNYVIDFQDNPATKLNIQ